MQLIILQESALKLPFVSSYKYLRVWTYCTESPTGAAPPLK